MISPLRLNRRHLVGEMMDQPDLETRHHQHALGGLSRINRLSNAAGLVFPSLRMQAERTDRPLRVLDLATGAGDLPIALARKAAREGLSIQIDGCDKSPVAIEYAIRNADQNRIQADFLELDLLCQEIPDDYDVVICSLFLHHLNDQQVVELLDRVRQRTGIALIVSDLRRCLAGYVLAWTATRALTRSQVVHIDGPLSVRAAFTIPEISHIAIQAGLDNAQITRRWPCRFVLTWQRH